MQYTQQTIIEKNTTWTIILLSNTGVENIQPLLLMDKSDSMQCAFYSFKTIWLNLRNLLWGMSTSWEQQKLKKAMVRIVYPQTFLAMVQQWNFMLWCCLLLFYCNEIPYILTMSIFRKKLPWIFYNHDMYQWHC